ncbi:MAG TPA: carboxypeptidase-like regulatory domain-containing protein [Conexibacter sp.]|nr:carboxypeptidase-like regulatory domain-containing protein [Conexibacter sp.]
MGARRRHLLAALRHDESGLGLIEVIVSSMLLVLVASGVYLGLDGASATSAVNKQRSTASGLAQEDQDRMRAMAVNELSNYRATTTRAIGPITYTIASSASWVTDSTGSASCTSGTARAHYLRIASSVTWPSMRIAPITVESVVAPPAGSFSTDLGSLAVQVRDRDGNGLPGVGVTLTGARNFNDTTNEAGCVLWGFLPVGNYTVGVSKLGYVDANGVAAPTQVAGVVGASTQTLAFDYDLAGWIDASFQTLDRAGGRAVAANGSAVSLVNGHWSVPRVVTGAAGPALRVDQLYPFPEGYGVYAGNCAGARPDLYGGTVPVAIVPRGARAAVTLFEPPVDLLVTRSGNPVAGAIVKLTGTASGCGALQNRTTGVDGYMTDRALPYGTYDVCVQATVSGTTYALRGTVANTTATGVPSSSATYALTTAGTCP